MTRRHLLKSGIRIAMAVLTLMAFGIPRVSASICTLRWNANSETNLMGYKVYHTTIPGQYTEGGLEFSPMASPMVTGEQLGLSGDDQWHYFRVTAFNQYGESGMSNEVGKLLASSAPPPPPPQICLKYHPKNGTCLKWSQ